jgi:hypothetical protein
MESIMRINNLVKTQVVNVKEIKAVDLVVNYQSYSLGDGEWSIEAKTTQDMSVWGPSIMQWTGNNGTRGYEADDLWAEVEKWEVDPHGGLEVIRPGYSYQQYQAPDGTYGSYSFFKKEVMNGRLHGCVVSF